MDIAYLADHKEIIPTLAQWFYGEWSYLCPGRTVADIERLVAERTHTDRIPLALVAFEGGELVGTICLKVQDMETRPDLTPWLAALYVVPHWRRKGIGARLVSAIETKAQELRVARLYLYTPKSAAFYAGLGWQVLERTEYQYSSVTIMQKDLHVVKH
jgi:predicted N-acetyltransferase YhbS